MAIVAQIIQTGKKMTEESIINSDKSLEEAIQLLKDSYAKHKYIRLSFKTGRQRSIRQNRALHLYLEVLASALNLAGYDMNKTLRHDAEIPWNGSLVKELLWRPIQKAITGKQSTTEPEKIQYTEIYEVLNRHTASKLGVSVEWPTNSEDVTGKINNVGVS